MAQLDAIKQKPKISLMRSTPFIPLFLLLLVIGLVLGAHTVRAQSPGPEAGSIGITGIVPGEPPTTGANITSPANNQRFAESPVTVSGTCPANTLVEVYKNDIFAGSTICNTRGTFSFDIDLLIGQNTLSARVYDALNQVGPESNRITIFYDALPPQPDPNFNSTDFGGSQLIINTDSVFRGGFPNKDFNLPVTILGGTPPYAVNIRWGDTNNRVLSRNDNQSFFARHIYTRAGTYQISIQATDAVGRVAFLTVASIVNGSPDGTTGVTSGASASKNWLIAMWPFYVSLVAIVVAFWLGELYEKRLARHKAVIYR